MNRASSDVRVSLSKTATSVFSSLDADQIHVENISGPTSRPWLVIEQLSGGRFIRVRYDDDVEFVIDRRESNVYGSWQKRGSEEDAVTCLLGPVLGLLLYLRGETCLHASAVAHRGKALVFAGTAEAGKSTLAAAFARRGHRILTDDILVLDQIHRGATARPGIPVINLWPQSVEHLWGNVDALPRQNVASGKRSFDLRKSCLFQNLPTDVGAVYVLSERHFGASCSIEAIVGTEAALSLIANKYVTRLSDRVQDQRDFVFLSNLASTVPVRHILRSDALSDLDGTCEAILTDFTELSAATF